MIPKYVEERFSRYFIFGGCPAKGTVDVASSHCDTVASVSLQDADRIIAERDEIISFLCEMADAFDKAAPEAFKNFWYNGVRK